MSVVERELIGHLFLVGVSGICDDPGPTFRAQYGLDAA